MVGQDAPTAFAYVDATVDAMIAAGSYGDGANLLKEFVARVPGQIPALLKLVEVCVDGGLEAEMYETQAHLADAYLATGQAAEARVIAEDLVAREPWEPAHIDRFRRALVLLKVSDPDTLIAQRLSGEVPFTATDHFVNVNAPPPEPEPAPAPEPPKPAAATPARPGKSAGAVEIDLTTMLGDLEGKAEMTPPDPEELAKAVDDFKSEVSRQDGSEEAAQHLKLARTYLEMGMSAEAIGALETAARSPRHRFEAGAMLARLYRHQQDLRHAIEWFERAAEAPAPGAEAGRALLYDLGSALELSGDTARALAVFLELQADAGDYRDVAARVDRLGRVQTGG
jgi:tetratricopeptide (TPR) repeat protein